MKDTLTPGRVARLRGELVCADLSMSDARRLELLRELTDLVNTVGAVQAHLMNDLQASRAAADEAAGVPEYERRGVTADVARARREAPHAAAIAVGVATTVVREMPHTLKAMAAGVLSEYRARLLVGETACLSREDRAVVDELVCGDLRSLDGAGTRALAGRARRAGYELDPVSAVRRVAKAESERCVSVRPAPDAMVWLTALLPAAQGVACYAALRAAAGSAQAFGDPRGRGQVMADTLVARLTGQETPEAVPLGVHLVMSASSLFGGSCEPARIVGHGPVPSEVARRLVAAAPADGSWVKRLFTDAAGELVASESRSRFFPEGLAELIQIRDDTCATSYCDAPVRHIDHVVPWARGGPTRLDNAQGLCERCNHDRQAQAAAEADTGPPRRGVA